MRGWVTPVRWTVAVLLATSAVTAHAGDGPSPAEEFLRPYDASRFVPLYKQALDTFLLVEDLYQAGDYARAGEALDALWAAHSPGGEEWARVDSRVAGLNVGSPPCYYALRMYSECVAWRRGLNGAEPPRPHEVTLTVVLVGRSHGVQPRTQAELADSTGAEVEHTLHPLLLERDSAIVHQSLRLFREYMLAATAGRLAVRTRILNLPDLSVPVSCQPKPYRYAGLGDGATEAVWQAVPDHVRSATDWWWILYPSHVPGEFPEFRTTEFITGGMGSGPDGASPCFLIDDLWLVRKPPHLGQGLMTEVERRAYLPQWLQHEFFHHLFRTWPEFKLEAEGHQWFRRETWPADFQGRFEPDYYAEALHKRLQPLADPPMHIALRYDQPSADLYAQLKLEDIVGAYRHQPVENDWHVGRIEIVTPKGADGGPVLRWTNDAGVSWSLRPELAKGLLWTGEENPYYKSGGASRYFRVVLRRNADGDFTPEAAGFQFGGGFYALQPK